MSVDTASAKTALPFFFFRTLGIQSDGLRVNDKPRLAMIAYWVGNCQQRTAAIYALGSLGERDEVLASNVYPIDSLKMDPVQTGSANTKVFDVMCQQASAGGVATPENAKAATQSSGSGFFVTREGHILTNAHVVTDCKQITARGADRSSDSASVIVIDTANDLALVRVARRPDSFLSFRDTPVQVGEPIYVFGFPLAGALASAGSFSSGIVSANAGLQDDTTQLQISAPVQPGNSGGPLLDQSARVTGVIVSKLNALAVAKITGDIPQNVNFAIKQSIALSFLSAHEVKYLVNSQTRAFSQAEIAAQAKAATVYLECRR